MKKSVHISPQASAVWGFLLLSLVVSFSGCKSKKSVPSHGAVPSQPQRLLTLEAELAPDTTALATKWGELLAFEPHLSPTPPMRDFELVLRDSIVGYAKQFLGKPYRWGGGTPRYGFDCSGFTRYIYSHFGLELPHNSRRQSNWGRKIPLKQAEKGDLVFFGHRYPSGRPYIHHVGIVASEPGQALKVIHSAKRGLVLDTISAIRYWERRLLFSRSLLEDRQLKEQLL